MIPRRAQGANKDMIMRLLHGHGVSAACHKNEGSWEAMRHFVCWRMREI